MVDGKASRWEPAVVAIAVVCAVAPLPPRLVESLFSTGIYPVIQHIVTPASNLVEAGLDSLAVTQLLLALEESTGIWVDESLLTPENLASADALAACVAALVP